MRYKRTKCCLHVNLGINAFTNENVWPSINPNCQILKSLQCQVPKAASCAHPPRCQSWITEGGWNSCANTVRVVRSELWFFPDSDKQYDQSVLEHDISAVWHFTEQRIGVSTFYKTLDFKLNKHYLPSPVDIKMNQKPRLFSLMENKNWGKRVVTRKPTEDQSLSLAWKE